MLTYSGKNTNYLKEVLLSKLGYGRHNAVHGHFLAGELGLTAQQIRKLVQFLRDDGHPICSSIYDGYWLGTTSMELDDCLEFLTHKRDAMNDTIEALTNTRNSILRKELNED